MLGSYSWREKNGPIKKKKKKKKINKQGKIFIGFQPFRFPPPFFFHSMKNTYQALRSLFSYQVFAFIIIAQQ